MSVEGVVSCVCSTIWVAKPLLERGKCQTSAAFAQTAGKQNMSNILLLYRQIMQNMRIYVQH